jgi:predicted porin
MNIKHGGRAAAMLAAALAGADASAQTGVTVYGLIDVAIAHIGNADLAGHSMTKIPSLTGSLPSRLGVRGSEDLGGELSAVFTLEAGFLPDTGLSSQGNRLFGRQASVGLKGRWGLLQIGRIPTMTVVAMAKSDVLGPNLFSISSIDPYLPNARSDNAVGYTGGVGPWTIGATYSLGRDASAAGGPAGTNCAGEVAGDAQACRQFSGLLAYDSKAYGISASYDKLRGNAGAAFGLNSSERFDRRVTLNGYAMAGQSRIGAGLLRRTTDAVTGVSVSTLYYAGVSAPLTPTLTLDAQLAYRGTRNTPDRSALAVARLMQALSRRTAVYAGAGRIDNHGAAAVALDAGGTVAPGRAQNGLMAGIRHLF